MTCLAIGGTALTASSAGVALAAYRGVRSLPFGLSRVPSDGVGRGVTLALGSGVVRPRAPRCAPAACCCCTTAVVRAAATAAAAAVAAMANVALPPIDAGRSTHCASAAAAASTIAAVLRVVLPPAAATPAAAAVVLFSHGALGGASCIRCAGL